MPSEVPDGHVAAIADSFTIRKVDCGDGKNFLCGSALFTAAQKQNLLNDPDTNTAVWDGTDKTT